jgi:hypothetical protein
MNKRVIFALAGLETGITGALAMLIWLAFGSMWSRHSAWWVPNLVAAAVYGSSSLRDSIGIYTAVGTAMVLVLYGALGILFGELLGRREGGFRLLCFSLIVSLAVNWCLWKSANPLAHLYAPDGQILLGHLLFGCFLAGYPRALKRACEAFGSRPGLP